MLHAVLLVCALILGGMAQAPATTAPAPSIVGDVSGEWTGEVKTSVSYSPIPMHFKLQQKGTEVSGTAGPNAGNQYPIAEVKRSGKSLHFSVSGEGLKYVFDLDVNDDVLQGDAKGEDPQSHAWTGKASLKRSKTTEQ